MSAIISSESPIALVQQEVVLPPTAETTLVVASSEAVVEEAPKQVAPEVAEVPAVTEDKPVPATPVKRHPFTDLKNRFFAPKVRSLSSRTLYFIFLFYCFFFRRVVLATAFSRWKLLGY